MLNNIENRINRNRLAIRRKSSPKTYNNSLKFPETFLLNEKVEKPDAKFKIGFSEFDDNIRKLNYQFYKNSIKFNDIKTNLDKMRDELFLNLFRQIDLYAEEVENLNKKIEHNNNNKEYKILINNLKKQIIEKNEKIRYCEKMINEKICKEDKLLKEIDSYKRRIIFYKNKIKIELLTRNNEIKQFQSFRNSINKKRSSNLQTFRKSLSNINMRENFAGRFSPPIKLNKSPSQFVHRLSDVKSNIFKDNNKTDSFKNINQIIIEDKSESDYCNSNLSNTFPENKRNKKNIAKESINLSNQSQEEFINRRSLYDADKDTNEFIKEDVVNQVNSFDFGELLNKKNKKNEENGINKNEDCIKIEIKDNSIKENKKYINNEDEEIKNKLSKTVKKSSTKTSLISFKKLNADKTNITDRNTNKNSELNLNDSIYLYKNKIDSNTKKNISKAVLSPKAKTKISNSNNKKLTRGNNPNSPNFISIKKEKIEKKFHNINNSSNELETSYKKNPPTKTKKKILEQQENLKNENSIIDIQKLGNNFVSSNSAKNLNENVKKGIAKVDVIKKNRSNDKEKEISKILNEMNEDYINSIEMLSREEEQIKYMLSCFDVNNK